MKLRIVCPSCDEQQEIEMSEDEVPDKMVSCGKCRTPADIYDAETGERMELGSPYMPGIVLYEENSGIQVVIPIGLPKGDIVESLRTITTAIESNEAVDGVRLAEVAIAMETDKMVVTKMNLSIGE